MDAGAVATVNVFPVVGFIVEVAMTLGCSRGQAVWHVTLPAARRGMFAAFSIA